NILNRRRFVGTHTADISLARFHIQLDACQTGSVLPAVVLFFQQKIHFLDCIKACPVFFFVERQRFLDRKSTRLNSSHVKISYAVFCLKKKKYNKTEIVLKTEDEY